VLTVSPITVKERLCSLPTSPITAGPAIEPLRTASGQQSTICSKERTGFNNVGDHHFDRLAKKINIKWSLTAASALTQS
jgi:hypothetical protein